MSITVSLSFIFVLVTTHSQTQTFPYLSFNGTNLSNHSYIPWNETGDDTTDRGVECHLDTCCNLDTCCKMSANGGGQCCIKSDTCCGTTVDQGEECCTDLDTCSGTHDNTSWGWYFPNGNRVQLNKNLFQCIRSTKIVLYQNEVTNSTANDLKSVITGMYQCKIPVNSTTTTEIIYAGIFHHEQGLPHNYIFFVVKSAIVITIIQLEWN